MILVAVIIVIVGGGQAFFDRLEGTGPNLDEREDEIAPGMQRETHFRIGGGTSRWLGY